jgi:hypothetical protein
MARTQALQSADGIYLTNDIGNIMYAEGTTVPTGAGYAVGCIFIDTDASAGAQLWINEGSVTSASFDQVLTEGTGATFTGNLTFSGTNTHSGQETFDDLIETDFNPLNRVYARAEFSGRCMKSSSWIDQSNGTKARGSTLDDFVFSEQNGSGSVAAASDGGTVLYPGSKSISAFVFLKPRTGGPFDKIQWSSSKAPRFRAIIKPTGAGLAQSRIAIGLYSNDGNPDRFSSDAGAQSCSRRVELFHSSDSTDWKIHVGHSSGSSSYVTTTAAANNTVADVEFRIAETTRIPTVYINSTLAFTGTTPIKASTRMYPIVGIRNAKSSNAAAALPKLEIYHAEMSQNIA